MLQYDKHHIKITFIEDVLGMASGNPQLHEDYIASKAPNAKSKAEEIEAIGIEEVIDKGRTIFPKELNHPFIWDYQIRGYFKESCSMLRKNSWAASSKVKAFKKMVDGNVFVNPRKIMMMKDGKQLDASQLGALQRPLRASTPQGERVAIADSETAPAGTYIEFDVLTGEECTEELLNEWLELGQYHGFGQWRNAGYGKFVYEMERI